MKKILSSLLSAAIIVSTMSVATFSATAASDIVNIPDPQLKMYLTQKDADGKFYYSTPTTAIDSNGDGEISVAEAKAVTEIVLQPFLEQGNNPKGVTSLKGMEAFTSLKKFTMRCETPLNDISSLNALTQLKYLYISDCNVPTIEQVKDLTNLTYLNISGCKLTSFNGVEKMQKLITLVVVVNQISDISAAVYLPEKMTISVYDNKIDCTKRSVQQVIDAIAYKFNTLGGLGYQFGEDRPVYVSGVDPFAEAAASATAAGETTASTNAAAATKATVAKGSGETASNNSGTPAVDNAQTVVTDNSGVVVDSSDNSSVAENVNSTDNTDDTSEITSTRAVTAVDGEETTHSNAWIFIVLGIVVVLGAGGFAVYKFVILPKKKQP